MTFKVCLCALVLFCVSPTLHAGQETVVVAGANWPGFVHPDGSGAYLEPIKKAFANTAQLEWDITQFERARRLFLAGRADILVGVYRTTYPDKLYPSKPLDVENELKAYFFAERVTIKNIADLDHKAIAWRHGYEFESLLNNYTAHLAFDDASRAFSLLEAGKIDIILEYDHNVPEDLYTRLSSIVILPRESLWLVFQNTAKGQVLLHQYETANQ